MHEMKELFTEIKLYFFFFICVFTWSKGFKEFREEYESLESNPRSGWPL